MTKGPAPCKVLVLGEDHYRQLVEHCVDRLPHEACGVLAGRGGMVTRAYFLRNVAGSADRFVADPEEQVVALRSIDEQRLDLLAVFHSHPTGAAYPSELDVQNAYYPDSFHLIFGLRDPDNPEARAFEIRNGEISEVLVVVGRPRPGFQATTPAR